MSTASAAVPRIAFPPTTSPRLPGWQVLAVLPAQGFALARPEQGGEAAWLRYIAAAETAAARRCPRCGQVSRLLVRTGRCPNPDCGDAG